MSLSSSTGFNVEQSSTRIYDGKTLYVGGSGPGNYSKIQDAIDNSSDGDTVFVYNGTYYENVVVTKTIKLFGEDRDTTVIDAGGSGCPVDLEANETYVCGFTFQNSGNKDYNDAGIHFKNWGNVPESHNNTIVGNRMINNYDGIFGIYSEKNYVSNNVVRDNRNYGIYFQAGCDSSTITYNLITNNEKVGVFIQDSARIQIFRNTIDNNKLYGIYLFAGTGYNKVHENSIKNNPYGIVLDAGPYGVNSNDIYKNLISNNSKFGIYIYHGVGNIIRNNNLIDNRCHCSFYYELAVKIMGLFFLQPLQLNKFIRNYWDTHPLIIPKSIIGEMGCFTFLYYIGRVVEPIILMWFNFDWLPASEPYDIEV
jgi:parallel beta-helix repeat protein